MDALARLMPAAATLLGQVDEVLSRHGAPPEHEVWLLLRRVGMLPTDAVEAIAGLSAPPWHDNAVSMRRMRDGTRQVLHRLTLLSGWDGPAGRAFETRLTRHRAWLEAASDRQDRTAAYMDEVAAWCEAGRAAMAYTLARVISSAEAVTLVTGGLGEQPARDRALAAADMAVALLETFERCRTGAESIARSWGRQLTEVFELPVGETDAPTTGTVRVEL